MNLTKSSILFSINVSHGIPIGLIKLLEVIGSSPFSFLFSFAVYLYKVLFTTSVAMGIEINQIK